MSNEWNAALRRLVCYGPGRERGRLWTGHQRRAERGHGRALAGLRVVTRRRRLVKEWRGSVDGAKGREENGRGHYAPTAEVEYRATLRGGGVGLTV